MSVRHATLHIVQKRGGLPDRLTPTQQDVLRKVRRNLKGGGVVLIEADPGMGKTTILKALQAEFGGEILDAHDVHERALAQNPRQYEQIVYGLVADALDQADIVYFDDVYYLQKANISRGYARSGMFGVVFHALKDRAIAEGKQMVLTTNLLTPREHAEAKAFGGTWDDLGAVVRFKAQKEADYRTILETELGKSATDKLDVEKVYRFARKLNLFALRTACDALKARGGEITTMDMIDQFAELVMASNVDLSDVENITLDSLVGIEALAEHLDRTVLLPLRDPELAKELGLTAKHGVLLHGPPGTGKTTIGRALAHTMKGKFFVIGGDIVHDDGAFYRQVSAVFEAARRNSPAVIFIDDADVILTDPRMQHFSRYLLTKLDGLESESMGHVCVMMTAMDIKSMPAAMLRSGRLEVWLETTTPDAKGRVDMLHKYAKMLPFDTGAIDEEKLSADTEDFTAADLRRVVNDAAGFMAMDQISNERLKSFDQYLKIAVAELCNQKRLADAALNRRGGKRYH